MNAGEKRSSLYYILYGCIAARPFGYPVCDILDSHSASIEKKEATMKLSVVGAGLPRPSPIYRPP